MSNVEELGVESYVYADFNRNAETNIQESPTRAVIKAPSGTALSTGDVVEVSVDVSNIHVFDAETEKTIMPRIPEKTVLNVTVSGGKMNVCGSDIPRVNRYGAHVSPIIGYSRSGGVKASRRRLRTGCSFIVRQSRQKHKGRLRRLRKDRGRLSCTL